MVLFLIHGELGSGKSLALTYLAFRNWKKGRTIYSNYHLFGIPYFLITRLSQFSNITDGFFCVPPDEKVVCSPRIKEISEIKVGDLVLTHKGRFRKVEKVHKRWFDGELIKIKPKKFNLYFRTTPEHPILVMEKNNIKWKMAKDIKIDDLLVYPIVKTEIERKNNNRICIYCNSTELSPKGYTSDGKKRLKCKSCGKSFIEHFLWLNKAKFEFLNEDLAYIIGLFLADGSSRVKSGKVSFYVGKELVPKVVDKIKKLFNIEPKIYTKYRGYHSKNDCLEVTIHSRKLARMFNVFGKRNNKSAFEILGSSDKEAEMFLEGIIDGDGSKKEKVISIASTSPNIIFLSTQLLARKKIVPSISLVKGSSNVYMLTFCKNSLISQINENYILLPIKEIKKEKYSGYVYNLTVEEDNSYCLLNATLHNCGDEIWYMIDAYLSRKASHRFVADILRRSRKRKLTICGTAQVPEQVAPRIRKILDFLAYPVMSKFETRCKLYIFVGPKGKVPVTNLPLGFQTEPVFKMYCTEEEAGKIIDDVTEEAEIEDESEVVKLENLNTKGKYEHINLWDFGIEPFDWRAIKLFFKVEYCPYCNKVYSFFKKPRKCEACGSPLLAINLWEAFEPFLGVGSDVDLKRVIGECVDYYKKHKEKILQIVERIADQSEAKEVV